MTAERKANLNGIYDVHTNVVQYPKIMQPTHARWVQIDDDEVAAKVQAGTYVPEKDTIFPPVDPIYSRNYMVVDTYYDSNPTTNYNPGLDGDSRDLGFNGLSAITPEVYAALVEEHPECVQAFDEALARELEYKKKWQSETTDTLRKAPVIDKGVISL